MNTIKRVLVIVLILAVIVLIGLCFVKNHTHSKKDLTRNYEYENYCDSIWYVDRDYYLDVLIESYDYQKYIEDH